LAVRFASKLNLNHSQTNDLVLLSQLHDIGKTVIPDHILFKPGPLTDEEWVIMKTHSEKGFDILSSSPQLSVISIYVLHHHEHYDGSGYPMQLRGESIPYLSRIISIIDAFDVMTHKRVYKEAASSITAISEIEHCMGSQFDPHLATLFIEMVQHDDPFS